MFTTRFRLCRLQGIAINVDVSWLIILALLMWTLLSAFREVVPGLATGMYWLMSALAALAFFACILLHELGHAVVAQRVGIPVRGITLFVFGGVAEMEAEPASARSEFLMAVAGPLVSVFLAALFGLLTWLGESSGWPAAVVIVLAFLTWINAAVLIFNLVPAFPLDGGRVFRSLLWWGSGSLRRSTLWASRLGEAFAWVLIILGVLHLFERQTIQGVWLCLIGLFLKNAAQQSYQQVVIRQLLLGEPISRFMTRDLIVVPPDLDLRQWVEDYVYHYHRKAFPVTAEGRLLGIISTAALGNYPRSEWDRHTVAEAMERKLEGMIISPDTDAVRALEKMQRGDTSRLLVVDQEQLVGILTLRDLLGFLNLKLELEDEEAGVNRPPRPSRVVGKQRSPDHYDSLAGK